MFSLTDQSKKPFAATLCHWSVDTTSIKTVCRGRSGHLCDFIRLQGCEASCDLKALIFCPKVDEEATCKQCYMWGAVTSNWLHLCLESLFTLSHYGFSWLAFKYSLDCNQEDTHKIKQPNCQIISSKPKILNYIVLQDVIIKKSHKRPLK